MATFSAPCVPRPGMTPTLAPLCPPLRPLLGDLLQITLGGGGFSFPSTLQPTLLCVCDGALRIATADGGWTPLSSISLCGMSATARRAEALPGTRLLLVAIRAGQLPRLFGPGAGEFANTIAPLDTLLPASRLATLRAQLEAGAPPSVLHTALTEALLASHCLNHERAADLRIPRRALFSPVSELSRNLGLSERQFERRFRASTGQSLRAYRQQFRWSQLLRDAVFGQRSAPDWASAAYDGGYVDQAHLHRDFRRFTGMTPGDLGRRLAGGDAVIWPYRLPPPDIARLFPDAA